MFKQTGCFVFFGFLALILARPLPAQQNLRGEIQIHEHLENLLDFGGVMRIGADLDDENSVTPIARRKLQWLDETSAVGATLSLQATSDRYSAAAVELYTPYRRGVYIFQRIRDFANFRPGSRRTPLVCEHDQCG